MNTFYRNLVRKRTIYHILSILLPILFFVLIFSFFNHGYHWICYFARKVPDAEGYDIFQERVDWWRLFFGIFLGFGLVYGPTIIPMSLVFSHEFSKSYRALSLQEKQGLEEEPLCVYKKGKYWVKLYRNHLLCENRSRFPGMYHIYTLIPYRNMRKFVTRKVLSKTQITVHYFDSLQLPKFVDAMPKRFYVLGYFPNELAVKIVEAIEEQKKKEEKTQPYHINSTLFDGTGSYGGSQQFAEEAKGEEAEHFNQIFQKNSKEELSKEQLDIARIRLGSEGCRYMAVVNTIFLHFENRTEEFERIFGMPYFVGASKKVNYTEMLVDFYSRYDNINPVTKKKDPYYDYNKEEDGDKKTYSYWNDKKGTGTTAAAMKYYLEDYCGKHSVRVWFSFYENVTPFNLQEYMKAGKYVIISGYEANIVSENGKNEKVKSHAMLATGVTENGQYIVSSWGKKYRLDPRDNDYLLFSTVEYL